jgi:hypothetical protein
MSPDQIVMLATAVASPVVSFGAAWLTFLKWRGDARRQADQVQEELKLKAKEISRVAAVETRRAITADWEAYAASMQEDRRLLLERVKAVESRADTSDVRLHAAEERAELAEQRAIRWESLYRIAVTYMRKLVSWASDVSHMSDMPDPPAELIDQL